MRWTVIPLLVLCVCANAAYAAQVIELVAGGGTGGDGAKATEAKLVGPFSTDFDKDGNMYIAEMYGNRLCKVDAKGLLHVVSGDGTKTYGGDGGPAKNAKISGPHNAITAPNGDVYIADTWNHRVRKIDAKTGVITTIAGSGKKGFGGDGGPAIAADFNETYCVALSPNAETLYIVDLGNKRVRAMDLKTGVVNTIAGNGVKGIASDGADAKTSPLNDPRAVCADKNGNVYILERGGSTLRRLDSNGKLHLLAGTNKPGSGGDGGPSLQASLKGPKYICMDLDDNVLIADSDNHLVRKVFVKEMKIERIAGTGKMANGPVGGSPLACDLNKPHGVYVHPDGTIYIADSDNNRVLKIKR